MIDGFYRPLYQLCGSWRTSQSNADFLGDFAEPGIGIISALELLLELQDVSRFRRAERLAAYVGLTPSPYLTA